MTEYAFRQIGHETYEVAKFEDNRTQPTSVYTLGKTFCTCPGSVRSAGKCTHIKMLNELLGDKTYLVGMFYDKDDERIYRPIPLDAPVDIRSACASLDEELPILQEIPF